MNGPDEDGTLTIITSLTERVEITLARMTDAVIRTERAADFLTGATHIDYTSLTSMHNGKAQLLLTDDLCARPVHTTPYQSDDDYTGIPDLDPEP